MMDRLAQGENYRQEEESFVNAALEAAIEAEGMEGKKKMSNCTEDN